MEKLKAQEGEGCHMWGTLAVNKARLVPRYHPALSTLRALRACVDTPPES